MDHSFGESQNYHRPTEQELLEDYLKVVDSLTINEENRQKIKIQLLEGEKNEIASLKNQVNENSAMLSDVLELIKLRIKQDEPLKTWREGEYEKHSNKIKTIDKRLTQKGIEARKLIGLIGQENEYTVEPA